MKTFRNLFLAAFTLILGALVLTSLIATPPARAQQIGDIYCSQTMQYDASTTGSTRIFTAVPTSNRQVYICGFVINVGATAANVQLNYGTGTNCGTGTTALTPNWVLPIAGQLYDEVGVFHGMFAPAGKDVCINSSGAVPVQAIVFYTYQ